MKYLQQLYLFVIFVSGVFGSTTVFARPDIFALWADRYLYSATANAECQICHQTEGSPWNSYGSELNRRISSSSDNDDIILAFRQLENTSSDLDGDGVSNIDEITNGFQPGWTEGNGNPLFNNNNNQLANTVSPPFIDPTILVDHPAELTNPLTDIPLGLLTIELVEVADGFDNPLKAVTAPGINGSLFVVEQVGRIMRVDLTSGDKTVFLDQQNSVLVNASERGLLGLAFHPDFETNGLFYTYQSELSSEHPTIDFPLDNTNHVSAIVEYHVIDTSCNSTPIRQRSVLTIAQPFANHNGGDITFGPDGMLYIALGDGGGASDSNTGNDPIGNGRDNTIILGSVIRIDVNGSDSANGQYGIPSDNPFTDPNDDGLDEIFAYGFRNPYRISFDADTGDLYVGDVGQDDIEEVNLVINGGNYGWNWKEGSFAFYNTINPNNRYVSSVARPGMPNDLIDPIAEYDHDDGVSVIGGFVYRGNQFSSLSGRYIFAEYLGRLFYLDDNNNVLEFSAPDNFGFVLGFGEDVDNEMYALNDDGQLLKIQAPGTSYTPPENTGEDAQCTSEDFCFPIVAANGNIASVCL